MKLVRYGRPGREKPGLIDASGAAEIFATEFDGKLRFPVYAPVQLVPGSEYSDDSRAYTIDTYDGMAWIGVIPLATGLLGNCPLYSMLGISTCPAKS